MGFWVGAATILAMVAMVVAQALLVRHWKRGG